MFSVFTLPFISNAASSPIMIVLKNFVCVRSEQQTMCQTAFLHSRLGKVDANMHAICVKAKVESCIFVECCMW